MKIFSLFIIFCFLETLLCDVAGADINTIQKAFNKALPDMKKIHQSRFNLPNKKNKFEDIKLDFEQINSNNIRFKYDEFGLLQINFVNLKFKISGNTYNKFYFLKKKIGFSAQLTNFNWEVTYALSSTKLSKGKFSIKYKPTGESDIKFYTLNVKINNDSGNNINEKIIPSQIKNLNFSPVKKHLKKLVKLIFDNLQKN